MRESDFPLLKFDDIPPPAAGDKEAQRQQVDAMAHQAVIACQGLPRYRDTHDNVLLPRKAREQGGKSGQQDGEESGTPTSRESTQLRKKRGVQEVVLTRRSKRTLHGPGAVGRSLPSCSGTRRARGS